MAGQRLLIFQTHGVGEPRRTYAPLFFALTAAAMDMQAAIWFSMEGVTQLRKGAAEQVELEPGSGVTLKTWLDQAREAGVELLACAHAMGVEKMTEADLMEGVRIVGVAGALDRCLGADRVMYF
ncbi:MAG: hypothetical protein A3I03_12800 [Candidatus Rokubacteria bacterium RIFCSPLOWO2_02_FULL_68_19]|jgi:predicted peroxiredoxin|nr:MAG: hypothetical protein XU13_C0023G0016 [Candidatus Rokubacteria bacterium CSP1-6]OGL06385.1 MAG: hypothetical protein A3I03_12800 [Candidatus Rokubacteria bacterium RIFCSPLOWO2_02_FULL_68_19]OGL17229.1 MAG: hypothetical protein A3G97_01070 [Candidatus Rokubacteria bacterium RIFCSPLOWO2_12_FULL_69_21]